MVSKKDFIWNVEKLLGLQIHLLSMNNNQILFQIVTQTSHRQVQDLVVTQTNIDPS